MTTTTTDKTITRRSVICPCGGDIYDRTFDFAPSGTWGAVWTCENCGAVTPRTRVDRKTNKRRALDAYLAVREAWKPVDAALDALVTKGAVKSGALLVHAAVFNYHLRQLLQLDAPTNWDVKYHTAEAKADLAKAQAFVHESGAFFHPDGYKPGDSR